MILTPLMGERCFINLSTNAKKEKLRQVVRYFSDADLIGRGDCSHW